MGLIHTATLPPKAGYVEVEVNGERQYRQVPPSAEKRAEQAVVTDLQALVVDYEYRLILLELGVTNNVI